MRTEKKREGTISLNEIRNLLRAIAASLEQRPKFARDRPDDYRVMKFAHGDEMIRMSLDGETIEVTNTDGEIWFRAELIQRIGEPSFIQMRKEYNALWDVANAYEVFDDDE